MRWLNEIQSTHWHNLAPFRSTIFIIDNFSLHSPHAQFSFHWSIDCSIYWLIEWLSNQMTDLLIDQPNDWSIDFMISRLIDRGVDWLRSIKWLVDQAVDQVIDRRCDWSIYIDRLINDGSRKWLNFCDWSSNCWWSIQWLINCLVIDRFIDRPNDSLFVRKRSSDWLRSIEWFIDQLIDPLIEMKCNLFVWTE